MKKRKHSNPEKEGSKPANKKMPAKKMAKMTYLEYKKEVDPGDKKDTVEGNNDLTKQERETLL